MLTDRTQAYGMLVQAVIQRAAIAEQCEQLIFIPGRPHVTFPNSDDMFVHAVSQFMTAQSATHGELPLAWIGYIVEDRLGDQNEVQGFLLTDRRVIVKDELDGLFGKAVPRSYPLTLGTAGAAAAALSTALEATESYNWRAASRRLRQPTKRLVPLVLAELVTATLETLTQMQSQLPPPPASHPRLAGRIAELNIEHVTQLHTDAEALKPLAKLSKKLPLDPLEDIVFAIAQPTLRGIDGIVFTTMAAYSQVPGQALRTTPLRGVHPGKIRVTSAFELELGLGELHSLPTALTDTEIYSLAVLVTEWLTGTTR